MNIHLCLFVCLHSPFAVTTVVGFLDIRKVSISSELKSFLLDMCIESSRINHKHTFFCVLGDLRRRLSVSNFGAQGFRLWGSPFWITLRDGPFLARIWASYQVRPENSIAFPAEAFNLVCPAFRRIDFFGSEFWDTQPWTFFSFRIATAPWASTLFLWPLAGLSSVCPCPVGTEEDAWSLPFRLRSSSTAGLRPDTPGFFTSSADASRFPEAPVFRLVKEFCPFPFVTATRSVISLWILKFLLLWVCSICNFTHSLSLRSSRCPPPRRISWLYSAVIV